MSVVAGCRAVETRSAASGAEGSLSHAKTEMAAATANILDATPKTVVRFMWMPVSVLPLIVERYGKLGNGAMISVIVNANGR